MRPLAPLLALILASCGVTDGERVAVTAADSPGYPVDRFEPSGKIPERPLHVISVYEASKDHDFGRHPGGDATIQIDAQGGPFWLALSSYERVRWHLEGPGVAELKGVFIAGQSRHSIDGAGTARIVNRSGPNDNQSSGSWNDDEPDKAQGFGGDGAVALDGPFGCAYTYAHASGGGCEAGIVLAARAEAEFRAKTASFTGVYNGSGFRIKGP